MEFVVDPHTLERAQERGATEAEIEDVIDTGSAIPAKYGRIGKAKIFAFDRSDGAVIMSRKEWKCSTSPKAMLL